MSGSHLESHPWKESGRGSLPVDWLKFDLKVQTSAAQQRQQPRQLEPSPSGSSFWRPVRSSQPWGRCFLLCPRSHTKVVTCSSFRQGLAKDPVETLTVSVNADYWSLTDHDDCYHPQIATLSEVLEKGCWNLPCAMLFILVPLGGALLQSFSEISPLKKQWD